MSEERPSTLQEYGLTECTVEFWASGTPPKSFSTLRDCLSYLARDLQDEPLPSITVHAETGDLTINGPELEALVRDQEL